MSEENKNGGIKSFFKKVKDSLEKFDKKMTEAMDNDTSCPPLYPEEKEPQTPSLDPEKELNEEDCEQSKANK